jgi:hypothetical protein
MTDRVHSLTVVLDGDIRIDDLQPLIAAIRQMRNVAYVETHVSDVASLMAEVRAKQELQSKLFEALRVK